MSYKDLLKMYWDLHRVQIELQDYDLEDIDHILNCCINTINKELWDIESD